MTATLAGLTSKCSCASTQVHTAEGVGMETKGGREGEREGGGSACSVSKAGCVRHAQGKVVVA